MDELSSGAFQPWLDRWRLVPDGDGLVTPHSGSLLLPVLAAGAPAMLKVTDSPEEVAGGALMEWWAGDGAARVLAREGPAILLERVSGTRSLVDMARGGGDDEASRVLCGVIDRLQAPRASPPPASLVPLAIWFRALALGAARHGGVLIQSLAASRALLADPLEAVVLHGDAHHGNVLDGGARGWLAIDPKGVLGERGFDHAHILCNPDPETAIAPGRLARQVGVVARAADLDPPRLLAWILAYAGLSASWTLGDGHDASPALTIAAIAAAELA